MCVCARMQQGYAKAGVLGRCVQVHACHGAGSGGVCERLSHTVGVWGGGRLLASQLSPAPGQSGLGDVLLHDGLYPEGADPCSEPACAPLAVCKLGSSPDPELLLSVSSQWLQ